MTPAKLYAALVAFKDRIVEAYIHGMAEAELPRVIPPPLGTCGLCGRQVDYAMKEYERGADDERRRWTKAVEQESARWEGSFNARTALGHVLGRLGASK